jgi:hypothetical protein
LPLDRSKSGGLSMSAPILHRRDEALSSRRRTVPPMSRTYRTIQFSKNRVATTKPSRATISKIIQGNRRARESRRPAKFYFPKEPAPHRGFPAAARIYSAAPTMSIPCAADFRDLP